MTRWLKVRISLQEAKSDAMTTLRSLLKPNPSAATIGPTVFKTERNQHQFRCAKCGRNTYVDEDTFTFISYAMKAGLEDALYCEWCAGEYDHAA
jgi:hypothetical protein